MERASTTTMRFRSQRTADPPSRNGGSQRLASPSGTSAASKAISHTAAIDIVEGSQASRKRRGSAGHASVWMMAMGFLLGGGLLVVLMARFPGDVENLMKSREEVKRLRDENADLDKFRQERKERLRLLEESDEHLELEIRKELKLYHSDETIIEIPSKQPKPSAATTSP
jgi:cell division protein FtsB